MSSPHKIIRNVTKSAAISLVVAVVLVCVALGIGPSAPERALTHISDRFEQVDWSDLPPTETFVARDGETLRFRRYIGSSGRVVLALHGSGGAGSALHPTARALALAGYTVFVPDIRGHGKGDPSGDVGYIGQVAHDLDDMRAAIPELASGAELHLLGFSMGGGLALRYAVDRSEFSSVTLLSPYLAYDAPPMQAENPRAPAVPWATAAAPRIVALNLLNAFGITWANHLPVVALATDTVKHHDTVSHYSYRLMRSVNPDDWRRQLAAIEQPVTVVVGSADELHYAPAYKAVIDLARRGRLITVPGVDHMGLTLSAAGIGAVVNALQGA